jgi:hypothetical protein
LRWRKTKEPRYRAAGLRLQGYRQQEHFTSRSVSNSRQVSRYGFASGYRVLPPLYGGRWGAHAGHMRDTPLFCWGFHLSHIREPMEPVKDNRFHAASLRALAVRCCCSAVTSGFDPKLTSALVALFGPRCLLRRESCRHGCQTLGRRIYCCKFCIASIGGHIVREASILARLVLTEPGTVSGPASYSRRQRNRQIGQGCPAAPHRAMSLT